MKTYYFSIIMPNGQMDAGFISVNYGASEYEVRNEITSRYGKGSILIEFTFAHNGKYVG